VDFAGALGIPTQNISVPAERLVLGFSRGSEDGSGKSVRLSMMRSMLTEIYLCHACSCQEILRVETPRAGVHLAGGCGARL
jgi:hypothetical protein